MKRGTKRDSNGRLDGHMRESDNRAKAKRTWLDEVDLICPVEWLDAAERADEADKKEYDESNSIEGD
jgi:hypothetical protein